MTLSATAIFDGHNDLLLRLVQHAPDEAVRLFIEGRDGGHLDWPRMQTGGFVGGLFAVFIPSPEADRRGFHRIQGGYEVPVPAQMDQSRALPPALDMIGLLHRIERACPEYLRVCRTVADIRAAQHVGAIAAVLHLEGAEPVDADLRALDGLYAAGLRSIGPVWSRPTVFGHGVPFKFPSSPDTGPGLTRAGKSLVTACNDYGIVLDLSHLNEKGFWDTARLSTAPLVASHSNAHALCPHARNLTDEQLRAVADSGGIVGLNFGSYFLRPDGALNEATPIAVMLDHIDHMIGVMGADHVGLGSDFDGIHATPVADAADLPRLIEAMQARGYDDSLIARLSQDNWLRVLEATWGE